MNQEKRSLLAAGLSLVVLVGWYFLYGQKHMQVPQSASSSSVSSERKLEPMENEPLSPPSEPAGPETVTEKETPLVAMTWTSHGGTLKAFDLKKFRQRVEKESPPLNLIRFEGEKPLPLLCSGCSFSLPTDVAYTQTAQDDTSITYQAERDGLIVQKRYEWNQDQYLLNLKVTLENKSDREMHGKLGLGWKAAQIPQPPKGMFGFMRGPQNMRSFLYKLGGDVTHDHQKDEMKDLQGMVAWAGIEDRYFLISLISRRISSEQDLRLKKTPDWLDLSLYPTEVTLSPQGGRHEEQYSIYLGPKDRDSLMVAGVGLEKAVDYGWFGIIAIPILKCLQFFYLGVHNWGVAIILLTLFVKILMNPLTIKSMKQMKEMQKLQPQLAAMKERYKDDKQRLNMETMQLFKTHKVNPMGGCLPMLLQMPIYIALYKVLYNAIEIYHAPFVGFYRDLSAPDPYFILPILLGIAMIAQQKMTPSPSADPAQKQMMMIMPIMFTGFMLFLPLGLVLYIFVNTTTSVLQQLMYQRNITWKDLITGKWRKPIAA